MKTAPDPKDVQEFQFKQSHIHQLVNAFASAPVGCNLLVADKKRGLLYVGYQNKLIVIKPGDDSDPEWKFEVELPVAISKITLNCNCSFLAVAPHKPSVLIYDVEALVKNSLRLLHEVRISSSIADVYVNDLRWNPTIPGMLCTVASDHTIGNFQVQEQKDKISLEALEKLNNLGVLSAAWSPKGKQIAVGCKNGNIVQLKPDLKVARTISGPAPYIGGVISILWISNYQFCAAYLSAERQINVLIVDAPKGEATAIFTCYEDITYGVADTDGGGSNPRYYFDHVPEWGLIIAASSGSSEIAVLGSTDSGATWNQWQLVDSGRAELPLVQTSESYPVGIAIDKSPSRKLPWGADSMLPQPVPILHIFGTSGQLCSFHMVNLTPNCPAITLAPTEIVACPIQNRPIVAPADASMLLNAVATSTPRPKQPEHMAERQRAPPIGNIFGDSLKVAGFFQPPAEPEKLPVRPIEPEKVAPPPSMPVAKAEPVQELRIDDSTKMEPKVPPVKESPAVEASEQKIAIDESICVRAYLEIQSSFEKDLKGRQEPHTWECGTEEERKQLAERAAVIDQFLRDLRETTTGLSGEIAYLKALLLQSFAWVEETKSKNAASNNISTRSCGDNSKLAEIQTLYYYTQTQLTQATKTLDLEWSDKSRMKIPSLEFLYQNLVLHNKIIAEEKKKLAQLKKRWKSVVRTDIVSNLNSSMSDLSITSPKSSSSLKGNTGIIEARCKAIASKTLNFTRDKQVKLKNLLCNSTPRVIKPVNPSPIQDRLEATLSSLASQATAIAETKHKADLALTKQAISPKPVPGKPKQQNPLASLNSIVARIGSSEPNASLIQNKPQSKPAPTAAAFPTMVKKFPQIDSKQSSPVVNVSVPLPAKATQEPSSMFSQVGSPANYSIANALKGFPKMDSISFGTMAQKSHESEIQKTAAKESVIKNKEALPINDTTKTNTSSFSTGSLSNSLSSGLIANKQEENIIRNQYSLSATTVSTVPVSTKAEITSTFAGNSMHLPMNVTAAARNSPQESQQISAAQTFSFASPGNTALSALKSIAPIVQTQSQQPQDLSALSLGLSSVPAASNSNINNNPPAVNVFSLYQGAPASFSNVNGAMVNGIAQKTLTAPSSSSTVQEVSSTATASLPSNSVPAITSSTPSSTSLFSGQPAATNNTIFGSNTAATTSVPTFGVATTTSALSTFGAQPASSMVSTFSGFSVSTPSTGTSSTVTTSSTAPSLFQSTLSKSSFGETATTSASPAFGEISSTPSSSISFSSFKTTTTTAAGSIFGKSTTSPLTTNIQFPTTAAVSSTSNVFGKPAVSSAAMSFSNFSLEPSTFSTPSTFGNSWIFGGTQAGSTTTENSAPIFGGGAPAPASSASSIFGGNTNTMNSFGSPAAGSVFGGNAQKSGPFASPPAGGTSFFGGSATTTPALGGSSPAPNSVFNNPTTPTSPMLAAQSPAGFGQAPTFGAKPQGAGAFGGEPVFGSGFGTSVFGGNANQHAFGGPPTLGGVAAPIDNKVFGSGTGTDTFGALGSQPGGLSFSSLAQKSPESAKSTAFGGGSSFSTWR